MLSCYHYGVMMFLATAQSSTTSTSTCTWQIQVFLDDCFSKNILFDMYQHPHMQLCQNSSQFYMNK